MKFAVAYIDTYDELEVEVLDDQSDVQEFIEENPEYKIMNIVAFDGDDVDLYEIVRSNVSIDFKRTLHTS